MEKEEVLKLIEKIQKEENSIPKTKSFNFYLIPIGVSLIYLIILLMGILNGA